MRRIILPTLLLAAALAPPSGAAQGEGAYGVAPTDVPFGSAVRGEPLYRMLTLQNDKDAPVRVELRAENESAQWALPDERNLTLEPRSSHDVPLRMIVPADVANGRYDGVLYVHFIPNATIANDTSGARLAFAVRVNLSVEVGGEQVQKLEAGGLYAPHGEESTPPIFHWEVTNAGNVRAEPRVDVVVRRPDGTQVARESIAGPVLPPGLTQNLTFRLNTTLPRGQYVLEAALAPPGDPARKEEAWFDVVEPGALRRSGTLGALAFHDLGSRQETHRIPHGNAVELRAPFTNTGEIPVKAILRGYVTKDGQHVADLTSNELFVDPGETAELKARLPDLPTAGQYVVTAEIEYSGKVTPSQDAILLLEPSSAARERTPSPAWLVLVAAAVAAVAGAWVAMMRKRHRR